jgi:hypothetical protein
MKSKPLMMLVACAATAALLFVRSTAAEPAPDLRLDKILADWQQRRERIKTIRYRTSGKHIRPKGSFTDPYTGKPLGQDAPPHDITWPKSITLLLDFTTNRHRLEEDEQPYGLTQGEFLPRRVTTTVFASKELWTSLLRPAGAPANSKSPDVYVVSGNMRGQAFRSVYWPFFLGHGIVALTTQQHILPGRLAGPLEEDIYHVHGEGVFANRPCLVLRTGTWEYGTTGFDELWVDPERESAVLRQVAYVNDKVSMDIQIDYQETRGGWLPHSWTISDAYGDGRVFSIDQMQVDELAIDPAVTDADFHVDVKADQIVQRLSVPGSPDQITQPHPTPGPVFHVGVDGSWNEVVGSKERRTLWPYYLGGGGSHCCRVRSACICVVAKEPPTPGMTAVVVAVTPGQAAKESRTLVCGCLARQSRSTSQPIKGGSNDRIWSAKADSGRVRLGSNSWRGIRPWNTTGSGLLPMQ